MLGFGATFLALCQKWRPFRLQFLKKNFWEHFWSRRGYSRDCFESNLRSLAPLVSILQGFEWWHAGFCSAFFGPLSNMENLWNPILKKKFWKHLWSQKGYNLDYFKPNFRSLGPLVSISKPVFSHEKRFYVKILMERREYLSIEFREDTIKYPANYFSYPY